VYSQATMDDGRSPAGTATDHFLKLAFTQLAAQLLLPTQFSFSSWVSQEDMAQRSSGSCKRDGPITNDEGSEDQR
jgi:hypothetical protein